MKVTERRLAIWSAILAGVSLAVAIGFNGLQVRDSAEAQRQAKLATELGLLTQLQSQMNESVYARVQFTPEFRALRSGKRRQLSRPAYRATAIEAANMDYMAWLFNNGYLTTPRSDALWGPRMLCEYRRALAPGLEHPAQDLPELIRFLRSHGRQFERLGSSC
ncbi:MAG TPA: hypothetical protein VFI03_11510 [Solirubrobacterales bacterium]|nr:hypothetical protein [Solirubrobacterales bacterium]